jgi:hypothetical protein
MRMMRISRSVAFCGGKGNLAGWRRTKATAIREMAFGAV